MDALKTFDGKKLTVTDHRILWGVLSNKIQKVDRYNERNNFKKSLKTGLSAETLTGD